MKKFLFLTCLLVLVNFCSYAQEVQAINHIVAIKKDQTYLIPTIGDLLPTDPYSDEVHGIFQIKLENEKTAKVAGCIAFQQEGLCLGSDESQDQIDEFVTCKRDGFVIDCFSQDGFDRELVITLLQDGNSYNAIMTVANEDFYNELVKNVTFVNMPEKTYQDTRIQSYFNTLEDQYAHLNKLIEGAKTNNIKLDSKKELDELDQAISKKCGSVPSSNEYRRVISNYICKSELVMERFESIAAKLPDDLLAELFDDPLSDDAD